MPGPVSDTMPSLADRMRALAESGHARGDELREKADALDRVAGSFGTEEYSPQKLVGAWARARRVWEECSDEPSFAETMADSAGKFFVELKKLQRPAED